MTITFDKRKNKRISVSVKIVGIVALMASLLSLFVPLYFAASLFNLATETSVKEASHVTVSVALAVESDMLAKRDEQSIAELKKTFRKMVETESYNKVFMIANRNSEEYVMIADEHDVNYIHPTHRIGHPYGTILKKSAYSDTLAKVFASGTPLYDVGEHGRGDSFVLAYAPAFDEAGKIVGVVCLDMRTKGFFEIVWSYVFKAFVVVLLLNLSAIALYYIYAKKEFVSPLLEVADAAEKIARGNFDFKIDVKNNDEIGDLARLIENEVKSAFKNVKESIEYATRIEKNMLPSDAAMRSAFSDAAVRWIPKDIVGGDFYWLGKFAAGNLVIVGDCTGHGVPGALMAVICSSALSKIANEENCRNPKKILEELDVSLCHMLSNENSAEHVINDGLDAGALFLGNDGVALFAGTRIVLFVSGENEPSMIKGDNKNIGDGNLKNTVKIHRIPINGKTRFFMATDGLYDQVGEEKHIQLGYRAVKQIFARDGLSCDELLDEIYAKYLLHKGSEFARDDMLLLSLDIDR